MKNDEKKTNLNQGQNPTSKMGRNIIYCVIGLIALLVVIFGLFLHHYVNSSLEPLDKNDHRAIQVEIPSGSSAKKIGSILQQEKIIKSGTVFEYYTKSHKITNLKAGYYQLSPSMTLNKISKEIVQGGSPVPVQSKKVILKVKNGSTVEDVASEVNKKTDFNYGDFIKLMKNHKFFLEMKKKFPKLLESCNPNAGVIYPLQGYLYPTVYQVKKGESLSMVVESMLSEENLQLNPLYKKIREEKLNVQQTLTLASLLTNVGYSQNDKQMIAGVLQNRLKAKMPLKGDTIVLLDEKNNTSNLIKQNLAFNSKYNLYDHPGLGPGPFNNPDINDIQAVLNPKRVKKDYLYFFENGKKHKVYFAKKATQQKANIDKYRN